MGVDVEGLEGDILALTKRVSALEDADSPITSDELIIAAIKAELDPVSQWNYDVWTFVGEAVFKAKATFENTVAFLSDVKFGGRVTFADHDMAGLAIIRQSTNEVKVTFEQEFEHQPVITVTADNGRVAYSIKDKSRQGFTIYLPETSAQDENFSWIALSVKEIKTYESSSETAPEAKPTPTPDPNIINEGSEAENNELPLPEPGLETREGEQDEPSSSLPELTILDTELGYLNVRSEPNTDSDKIGEVLPGETYEVITQQDDWYQIEFLQEEFGWVNGNYVEEI